MEEHIFDVELVDWPIPWESKGQDCVSHHMLHHKVESLIIVDAEMLIEVAKNLDNLKSL
jgi:hypothetical protein